MSASHFYRRYKPDGRCKVICTQCFQTLGMAWDRRSLEEMESAHACAFLAEETTSGSGRRRSRRAEAPLLRDALQMHVWLLLPLMVLAIYLVPTALEVGATYAFNPWLAVILPGDAMGCAVLAWLLRMPRTGILLYLVLTLAEGLSYAANRAIMPDLRWLADLVPTLLVVTLVLRMKLRSGELAVS